MEEKTAFLYIMSSEKTEMEKLPLIQNQVHSRSCITAASVDTL